MTTKLMIIGGCVCLLLAGCSTPQGGTADESTTAGYTTNYDEGITPAPMNTPNTPAGINPRDMRDPQAVTIPGPPMMPRQ